MVLNGACSLAKRLGIKGFYVVEAAQNTCKICIPGYSLWLIQCTFNFSMLNEILLLLLKN